MFQVIAKLEQRVREVESELDAEQRRYQDANKNLGKADRRVRELQFQVSVLTAPNAASCDPIMMASQYKLILCRKHLLKVDEDKKNFERLQDLIDKLQNKLKTQKRQIEEAVRTPKTFVLCFLGQEKFTLWFKLRGNSWQHSCHLHVKIPEAFLRYTTNDRWIFRKNWPISICRSIARSNINSKTPRSVLTSPRTLCRR